jgi:hypothetical protein
VISVSSDGSFKKTESFLKSMTKLSSTIESVMHACGKRGVQALSVATPIDTGRTARSWDYQVSIKDGRYSIIWTNSDIEGGFPVAIMLQYGYGTGTGGYVQGVDYINPAVKPIFEEIRDKVWKAVTSA